MMESGSGRKSQFSVAVAGKRKQSQFSALKERQAIAQGAALCIECTGLIAPRLMVSQK